MKCPTVRATRGSFSGPMTISATAPINMSLSKPKSTIVPSRANRCAIPRRARSPGSGLGLCFHVHRVGVRGLAAGSHLLGGPDGVCGRLAAGLHAVLEALDSAAEIGADI